MSVSAIEECPSMEKNNEMPYMKYFIDGIPPEIAKKAEKELGENEEVKAEALKELRGLIKAEPDLNSCMEDAFLLRFLRTRKFKVDKAFKTLKNFYTYKATYSGIFTDFTPKDVEFALDMNLGAALEYRDPSNTALGYIRFGAVDFHKTSPDEMLAVIMICQEVGVNMESVAVTGYTLIIDFEGLTFYKIRKFLSPAFVYRLVTAVQDVIPCRIKAYHYINQPFYFNLFHTIAKSFMSEKLSSRVHLHGSNLKSLYKHIPQEILPEELGGKQGPMSKFCTEYKRKVLSMNDHFVKMSKFGFTGETLKQLQKDNPHAIVT